MLTRPGLIIVCIPLFFTITLVYDISNNPDNPIQVCQTCGAGAAADRLHGVAQPPVQPVPAGTDHIHVLPQRYHRAIRAIRVPL